MAELIALMEGLSTHTQKLKSFRPYGFCHKGNGSYKKKKTHERNRQLRYARA